MLFLFAMLGCNKLEPCEPAGSPVVAPSSAPKNLLMISIDTLRRDRVGYYSGGDLSPVLDGLLSAGVSLEDHRSCSNWTYASVMCGFTGRNNLEWGFMPESDHMAEEAIPKNATTLGSWLGGKGYSTGMVTTNFWMSKGYRFDEYYKTLITKNGVPANEIVDEALGVVDAVTADGPWYFHVHFIDPHIPYNPPQSYLGGLEGLEDIDYDLNLREGVEAYGEDYAGLSESERALVDEHLRVRYDGEIAFMDDELGRLMTALEEKGLLEDTLVVVWSDHGEQFFDHGWYGHAAGLYAEETRAIVGLSGPGISPGTWSGPTTHQDLFPTIAAAMGMEAPEVVTGTAAGMSLEGECPRFATHMSGESTSQTVDMGGWRLVYKWDGTLELYDLTSDPTEQDDQFSPEDPQVEALWPHLEPRVESIDERYNYASAVSPDL